MELKSGKPVIAPGWLVLAPSPPFVSSVKKESVVLDGCCDDSHKSSRSQQQSVLQTELNLALFVRFDPRS